MGNMIKVVVFSSKLNNRPTIEVKEGATKLDLKNALAEAGLDYSGLSFADGMNQQELKSDSSIITTKAGKALLTLTPRRNKAGGNLSFSELRALAKLDSSVKEVFIKKANELNKNWTQLKTSEMNKAYVELNNQLEAASTPIKETAEPKNIRGLSPEIKEEIRNYINQILLEKEELEFKAVLNSMESGFEDEFGNGDDEYDEDEYYY